ncbi:MAG: hypothetical protein AAB657_02680 [Patescibacteria group bacterium]
MLQPKIHSSFARAFYFWSGIIATIAYRIIIVFSNVDPIWLKISWYIGTIGFVIYFAHRFQVSENRAKIIDDQKLVSKIDSASSLSIDDKTALTYVLQSLKSSKERWNYIVIFVLSGLALIYGIFVDFL